MVIDEVARVMIKDLEKALNKGFSHVSKRLNTIETSNKEMFNHLSNRLPVWASWAFAILTSALGLAAGIRL